MLFSDAFDEHLGVRYKQLVAEFFQMPRIVFSQNRETDLAEELVACMAERWFKLLNEEALKHKQDAWVLQRGFVHRLVGAGDKVFWDFAGGPGAAYHTELSISSMGESPSSVPLRSTDQSHKATRLGLDSVHEVVNSQDMKAQWPLLKKRLQKAAQPVGTKSKLAEFLGVKIASVSQWLSDSDSQREPGAETTLQLLKWVELQERQAK